jgi:hypothetical protein
LTVSEAELLTVPQAFETSTSYVPLSATTAKNTGMDDPVFPVGVPFFFQT